MKRKLNAPLSAMIDVIQLLYHYVYLVCKKQQNKVRNTDTILLLNETTFTLTFGLSKKIEAGLYYRLDNSIWHGCRFPKISFLQSYLVN